MTPPIRVTLAAILNGVLLNITGLVYARGLPWQQFMISSFALGGLILVPWLLLAKRDGSRAALGKVMIRNGIACVLGAWLPLEIVYAVVVRVPGVAFAIATAVVVFTNGALFGFLGHSSYYAFGPGKKNPLRG